MTYTTIRHPRSGEMYAAEVTDEGAIVRAAGPLRLTEAGIVDDAGELMTWEALADYINNQPDDETAADAAWLTAELTA